MHRLWITPSVQPFQELPSTVPTTLQKDSFCLLWPGLQVVFTETLPDWVQATHRGMPSRRRAAVGPQGGHATIQEFHWKWNGWCVSLQCCYAPPARGVLRTGGTRCLCTDSARAGWHLFMCTRTWKKLVRKRVLIGGRTWTHKHTDINIHTCVRVRICVWSVPLIPVREVSKMDPRFGRWIWGYWKERMLLSAKSAENANFGTFRQNWQKII